MSDRALIRARPAILRLGRAVHGGPTGDDAARTRKVVDFSVCTNPYGPSDAIVDAVRNASIDEYPDPTSSAARRAVAVAIGEVMEHVVVGAGSCELIYAVCHTFIRPGDRVVVPTHAFGEYARAATIAGAKVSTPSRDVAEPATAFARCIVRTRPRLAFVCTPDTPMGRAWTIGELRVVADACETAGTLLVLDQAYDAFATAPLGVPALRAHTAVVHLRSLTKDHGIPGVRIGYAVANREICRALEATRLPWSAGAHAQAAIVACMNTNAIDHASRTIHQTREHAHAMSQSLSERGWEVAIGDTHYFLVRVGNATQVRDGVLARHAVRLRDATSFGLPEHVRIAPRLPDENAMLLEIFDTMRPVPAHA